MKNCYYLFVLITVMSCKPQSNDNYKFYSEIKDDSLKRVITDYAKVLSLDRKSHYVGVSYSSCGQKVRFAISSGKSKQAYHLNPPDFFAKIEDVVVLLRITNGQILKNYDISEELDNFMAENEINLENIVTSYDPPSWVLTKCQDGYKLSKEAMPYIQDFLPCGYSIKRDPKTDSVSLIKKIDAN